MQFRWIALAVVLAGTGIADAEEVDLHLYMKGRRVYEKQCVWCHGRTGRGDGEWAKGVAAQPRNFRTGVFKFRSTRCGCLPTDEDLERTIRNGISGTMMPAFKQLPDPDLKAVIYYVKSLSSRWKDPKNRADAEVLPQVPGWWWKDEEKEPHIAKGKALFTRTCAACHGEKATGDGPGAKGLKDVWGFEIAPADLTKSHHKSGDRPTDLFRTVALGLDGTPMIGYREAFEDEAIWQLVAYIQSVEAK